MADTTTATVNSQGALGDFLKPPVSPTPVTPAPRTDPALSPADSPSSSPAYQTPQTKPAPAVITATPATQTVNQMKTTLNTQTSGIQNQAVNNQTAAQVKTQADQTAAQNKSLTDATAALANPSTHLTADTLAKMAADPANSTSQYNGNSQDPNFGKTDANGNVNIGNGTIIPAGSPASLYTKYGLTPPAGAPGSTPAANQIPGQDSVDALHQQVLDNQAKIDDAYNGYQTTLTQMQNGTLPLSPDQQTQIDATKVLFQQAHDALALINKNYIAGVGQTQVSNGLERYSPLMAMGEVQDAVTSSAQKLAELDAKNAQALGQLRLSFLTNNMDMAQKAYTAFQDYMKQKDDTLTNLADTAQKHLDTIVSQQQQQEQIDNAATAQKANEAIANANLTIAQKNQALNDFKTSADLKGFYYTDKNGNTMDAQGNPITADTPGAQKVSTEQAIKDAEDNLYKQQDLALKAAANQISAEQKTNPLGISSATPTTVKSLVGQGIFNQTAAGLTYLDTGQFSTPAAKSQAEDIARAAGIPIISSPAQKTALTAVDEGQQTLDYILNQFKAVAPTNVNEKIDDVLTMWAKAPLGSPQANAFAAYNSLQSSILPGVVRDITGLNRVTGQEIQSSANALPVLGNGGNDTFAGGLAKIQALQGKLNINASTMLGGKQVYTDINQFVSGNPNPTGAQQYVDKVRSQFPSWSPDDVLQYIYSQQASTNQ